MIAVACLLAGLAFGYGWATNNGPLLLAGVFVAFLALWTTEHRSDKWRVAHDPEYHLPSRADERLPL